MTTMAHPAPQLIESNDLKMAGGVSIAELRSKFQKEDGVAAVTAAAVTVNWLKKPKQQAAGDQTGHKEPNNKAVLFPAISVSEIGGVRERLQKFGHSTPISQSPGPSPARKCVEGNPNVAKKSNCGAAAAAPASQTLSDSCSPSTPLHVPVSSKTAVESDHDGRSKRPKPALPARNSASVSPSVGRGSVSPQRHRKSDGAIAPGAHCAGIKPNPSHLSTLISEIKQQQSLKQGAAAPAPTDTNQSRPPPPIPSLESPSNIHRRNLSVDLGPPPPIPTPHSASPPFQPPSKWKRIPMPSLAELGTPPSKPSRPPSVKVPPLVGLGLTPPLPQRNPARSASDARLSSPCSLACHGKESLMAGTGGSSSPIPEFTEEEELGLLDGPYELYDDTAGGGHPGTSSITSAPTSSTSLTSNILQADELYQDASLQPLEIQDVYEDIGVMEKASSEPISLMFGLKREEDRKKKEEERKLRKQQKETEKKLRELEKLRKKYNLTGNEAPVDWGVAKETTKGRRRDDLSVKGGEKLAILRISNNPVGKWLVQNEEGRVGYVDLTNIEVDASSIRYVMAQSKSSIISANDDSSDIYEDGLSGENEGTNATY